MTPTMTENHYFSKFHKTCLGAPGRGLASPGAFLEFPGVSLVILGSSMFSKKIVFGRIFDFFGDTSAIHSCNVQGFRSSNALNYMRLGDT